MRQLIILFTISLLLTGCLSHWFMETDVRLQIENKTSYTIVAADIISLDTTIRQNWIQDTIYPGERSSVVTGNWVGTFNLGISYIKDGKKSKNIHIFESIDFEGGSIFAQISEKDGFWTFDQK